jgi:group I intron endonuclease
MPRKETVGFYVLHNRNTDETYVGSGILSERKYNHETTLREGTHHNYKLQMAYNRDPNFEFVGIPVDEPGNTAKENRDLALELEQSLIDEHADNLLLLNIVKDVERPRFGVKDTPETIERKREGVKKHWANLPQDVREEKKERYRQLMTGNTHGVGYEKKPDEIERWRESRAGYQHSEETKAKIGAANKISLTGRTLPPEHRDKVVVSILQANAEKMRRVSVNGIIYDSLNDAARSFGINPGTAYYRINATTDAYKEWFYID